LVKVEAMYYSRNYPDFKSKASDRGLFEKNISNFSGESINTDIVVECKRFKTHAWLLVSTL
jgi:hypothetical protein